MHKTKPLCSHHINTFENTNICEHLVPVKCYLQIADFVIISHHNSHLRIFVEQVTIFYDKEFNSLQIPFSKESTHFFVRQLKSFKYFS